ncbi:MAG: TonB-dependent hemoglobin/transferrin/lactoferrin family receptor, partial [Hyphomicrobiaceae bacterium]
VQGTAVNFNIPAQSLTSALTAFARQSGVRLAYPASLTAGKSAPALNGQFTRSAALSRLLSGSGLVFSFTATNTATISDPSAGNAATATVDGAIALDTIDVQGGSNAASGSGYQGTPDWVYETPSSISVISSEAIKSNPTRSARDLFASVPGVLATSDTSQNQGINVSIRGLQDQTRINMMIDGARQNFQRNGHGSTGYTYVDTALIREVDIEKSGTSGMGGAASLGGYVNFRTIIADDLIAPGKSFGGELDVTRGTNEYDFSGSASVAARLSDRFSILGGISRKRLGEYEIGKHGRDKIESGSELEKPIMTGSETWSSLLKAEIKPTDDTNVTLSWLRYKSEFSQGSDTLTQSDLQDITNDTLVASFGWKPANELIDMKGRLWFNHVQDKESRTQRTASMRAVAVDYSLGTFGGSLENTSRFNLLPTPLALNYGFEAFRDDGKTVARGADITSDPDQAWWYQGANPGGRRDIVSGFVNATIDPTDWLSISGGVRYDYYRVSASTAIFGERVAKQVEVVIPGTCIPVPFPPFEICGSDRTETQTVFSYPVYEQDVQRSGGAMTPTAKIAVTPTKGLQLFGTYSQSYRPPTLMEAALGGTHVGGFGQRFAPNPWIDPEQARTWEAGINLSFDGVFRPDDKFRMKAVGFYREVKDYIAVGTIDLTPSGTPVSYGAHVNLDGTTPMKGVEVDANYDTGSFYIGGAFSFLNADYASTYTYNGASYDAESYILFVPPEIKYSLDGGVRLFDQKLTVGGRMTYVGAADKHIGLMPVLLGPYQTGNYRLFDLYGSFAFNDAKKLRFAVNNITDVAYVPALGLGTLPAPGRTATLSLQLKF